ncbi:hypothetical protein NL676_014397 [Syzygium grande]|nr:hypothetical protein NL676_014397 [Syzygium grande]
MAGEGPTRPAGPKPPWSGEARPTAGRAREGTVKEERRKSSPHEVGSSLAGKTHSLCARPGCFLSVRRLCGPITRASPSRPFSLLFAAPLLFAPSSEREPGKIESPGGCHRAMDAEGDKGTGLPYGLGGQGGAADPAVLGQAWWCLTARFAIFFARGPNDTCLPIHS